MDYHMQFMEFHSLLHKRRLLYVISEISILSPKMWTIICTFWNFFPFFEKRGLSYAISTNIFSFSKKMDYHMQFIEFLSLFEKMVHYLQFLKFLSLLQKRRLSYAVSTTFFPFSKKFGLSYAVYEISFPSPKMWTIKCNFW